MTITEGAVQQAFPGVAVRRLGTLAEAAGERGAGVELLVLANPGRADLAQALATTDIHGGRRWAVVAVGAMPPADGLETITFDQLDGPDFLRALRSAVAQHQLGRENTRLRGDLRTLSRRILHDLRTPLGGIVAAGEALKEVLAESNPAQAGLVRGLFDSVDEMNKLMERVGLLLRASADPVPNAPVAMQDVLFRVLQRLETRMVEKGASVAQPECWPQVAGVAAWLETVWTNLLTDAVQQAPDASRIELGWDSAGPDYRFWVLHGGWRAAPERLRTLFQPFDLLHQPNAPRGIGLAIVQRLVELQGGNCGYEAPSTGGARFFFTLPAETGREAAAASSPESRAASRP